MVSCLAAILAKAGVDACGSTIRLSRMRGAHLPLAFDQPASCVHLEATATAARGALSGRAESAVDMMMGKVK